MGANQQMMMVQKIAAGGAGPTLTTATGGTANSTNTITIAVTPSGSNRFMCVVVCGYTASFAISSATFNGSETLTAVAGATGNLIDSSGKWAAFYLTNPSAVTANLVVTMTGTPSDSAAAVACFSGVNQTTPFGTPDVTNANLATGTVNPTSNTGELAVMLSGLYASPGSDGGGQTLAYAAAFGSPNLSARISYKAAAATSTSMTVTATLDTKGVGISLKP